MSDYLADKINEHVFRGNSFTPPTNLYLALADTFTNVEYSGNGYARVLITLPDRQSWEVGGARNNTEIAFAAPTDFWGRPLYVRLFDAATGGNQVGAGALTILSDSILSRWVSDKGTMEVRMWANPANNDTITIDGVTYRFRTTLSAAYDVKIGTDYFDQEGTLDNLGRAIMDSGTAGTHYGTGTVVHPTIQCTDIGNGTGFYGYEQLDDSNNTDGLLLEAKSAPGNGLAASTNSNAIGFEYSGANGTVTSGGGAPFTIPVHSFAGAFYPYTNSSGTMNYLANKLYDWFYRAGSFTPPSGLVVALYTTTPAADDTGGVECADAGYSRQSISIGAYDSGNNRARNDVAVLFGAAAVGYTVKAAVIRDGSDNPLVRSIGNVVIATGNQLRFDTTGSSYYQIRYEFTI